jgi:hypothetical protein
MLYRPPGEEVMGKFFVSREWSSEQRLCEAVLLDAVERGDLAWVNRGDLAGYIFSFGGVCEALGLASEGIRRHLNATMVEGEKRRKCGVGKRWAARSRSYLLTRSQNQQGEKTWRT